MKPKSKMIRYPTQFMSIGAIRCLFLSCYDRGQSPILTLGPSWPFTCFLLGFAGMIFAYFSIIINYASNPNVIHLYIVYAGLALNLLLLFTGILKNPGIPKKFIKRLLKERLGKSLTGDGELSDEADDSQDLEAGSKTASKQKQAIKNNLCYHCKVE